MATGKYDEHHMEAFLENARFLREAGVSKEQIAARLGVNVETLEKRTDRNKRIKESQ